MQVDLGYVSREDKEYMEKYLEDNRINYSEFIRIFPNIINKKFKIRYNSDCIVRYEYDYIYILKTNSYDINTYFNNIKKNNIIKIYNTRLVINLQ
jgi:hypothetical protein